MPIASLERIIRPRISPRIRPIATPQVLPSEDDETGIARITGNAQVINLSHSYTSTQSRQTHKELRRTFDLVRVKQKESDNTINEDNYVDVEVAHKLRVQDGRGLLNKYNFAKPPIDDNIELLEEDKTRLNSDVPVN